MNLDARMTAKRHLRSLSIHNAFYGGYRPAVSCLEMLSPKNTPCKNEELVLTEFGISLSTQVVSERERGLEARERLGKYNDRMTIQSS